MNSLFWKYQFRNKQKCHSWVEKFSFLSWREETLKVEKISFILSIGTRYNWDKALQLCMSLKKKKKVEKLPFHLTVQLCQGGRLPEFFFAQTCSNSSLPSHNPVNVLLVTQVCMNGWRGNFCKFYQVGPLWNGRLWWLNRISGNILKFLDLQSLEFC